MMMMMARGRRFRWWLLVAVQSDIMELVEFHHLPGVGFKVAQGSRSPIQDVKSE